MGAVEGDSMSASIYEIPVRRISGEEATLAEYKGKVLLVVNVASKCGLTKHYEGLENLYKKYADKGLVVVGFPANDFAGQEPGSDAEIQAFCSGTFGIQFPLYSKITVVGPEKHPLYKALIAAQPVATKAVEQDWVEVLKAHNLPVNEAPELLWNFEKFLVSRSGEVVGRFVPNTEPENAALVAAIEAELAK
jgi:glutathione peroxidase